MHAAYNEKNLVKKTLAQELEKQQPFKSFKEATLSYLQPNRSDTFYNNIMWDAHFGSDIDATLILSHLII